MTATTGKKAEAKEPRKLNKVSLLSRSPQDTPAGWANYVFLVVVVFISAWPIYWMGIMSTWTEDKVTKAGAPEVTIGPEFLFNLEIIMGWKKNVQGYPSYDSVDFMRSFLNTILVVAIITAGTLFFCSLAGFAFAKLRFRGRDPLFLLVVLTLTIPAQLGIVGAYQIHDQLGWIGTPLAVTVPALVSAFGVFYMRQFIEDAIPDEIIESARVDGASTFRVYWNIAVPVIRPAMGVLGLITAIAAWQDPSNFSRS